MCQLPVGGAGADPSINDPQPTRSLIDLHPAVQSSTVQCRAVQCSAVQCSAVQRSTVQCMQYDTVQFSAVQYDAVPCSAMMDPARPHGEEVSGGVQGKGGAGWKAPAGGQVSHPDEEKKVAMSVCLSPSN